MAMNVLYEYQCPHFSLQKNKIHEAPRIKGQQVLSNQNGKIKM